MTRSARPSGSARPPDPPRKGGFAAAVAGPGRTRKAAPAPAPQLSETQVHLQVADYFRKVGLGGCAIAFHIRNERTGPWQKINAHRMGILPGVCDWIVLDVGQAGFIELKPSGWKASKRRSAKYTPHELRQGEAQALLRRAGCWVEVCESLDEVLATLRYHGVPLKEDLAEPPLITALRQSMTEAEMEADALNSHDLAMRAIGEQVRAGGELPPLHAHLFNPRRRGGS
jgi:hypothetical protein